MEQELKVQIARQHRGFNCLYPTVNEISISEIFKVKWDTTSGGVQTNRHGYSLYGEIDYELASELVDCSGQHGHFGNNAKVLILKPPKNSKYWAGYEELLKLAGDKKIKKISRPAGEPPCTQKILLLLSETAPRTRGKMRTELLSLGYQPSTVARAFRDLFRQHRIICIGSPNSKYQQIFLPE